MALFRYIATLSGYKRQVLEFPIPVFGSWVFEEGKSKFKFTNIIAVGPEDTETQHLIFAQSFNPVGSLIGLFVCTFSILTKLDVINLQKSDRSQEA